MILELQFSVFAVAWYWCPSCCSPSRNRSFPATFFPQFRQAALLLGITYSAILRNRQAPSEVASALHALLAHSIVPAVLIGYAVTQHRLPGGRPMLIAVAIAFVLCSPSR